MGIIRVLLALSVLFTHAEIPLGLDGRTSVQLFYVISGFLISYVLTESKRYSSVGAFYLNRYLRLYPVYLVVLVLTIIGHTVAHYDAVAKTFAALPLSGKALLAFSNTFIFGQDVVMFTSVNNGLFSFAADFQKSSPMVFSGLVIQQAWTLGVEFWFYLCAPFILNKPKRLFALLGASMLVRGFIIYTGLIAVGGWSYRFFPAELSLFLLGSISQQYLLPYVRKKFSQSAIPSIVTLGFAVSIVLSHWIPEGGYTRTIALISVFIVSIPFTFVFQNQYKLDSWIGNLSYPIYINHMLVLLGMRFVFQKLGIVSAAAMGICSVITALAFAYCLERLISTPVERLRKHIQQGGNSTRA